MRANRRCGWIAAFLLLSGSVVAQEAAPVQAPVVSNPEKQMEASTGRLKGKEARTAFLPMMQLRWAVRSKVKATGGVFQKHKSSNEIFAPADQALMDRVLLALHDDLAERLRVAGWQAVTLADFEAGPPQFKTLSPDAKLGLPLFKWTDGVNEVDWAVVGLPGTAPADPKAIGNGMAIARFLKGKSGINLNIA